MPTIDLELASIVSDTFNVTAGKMATDDGNAAQATVGQVAVLTLDDLPAEAHTVSSAKIFVEGGREEVGKIALAMRLKLLTSGATTLTDETIVVDTPASLNFEFNTATHSSTTAGAFTPAMVNDMRLHVQHEANLFGTIGTLIIDYIYVRVVYTLVSVPPETYDSSANNIHCTVGNIHVKSGNILL